MLQACPTNVQNAGLLQTAPSLLDVMRDARHQSKTQVEALQEIVYLGAKEHVVCALHAEHERMVLVSDLILVAAEATP